MSAADADGPWLVVGLGNAGPEYARHRHNVGAMVVDALAAGHGARFSAHRARAAVAQVRLPPRGDRPGPALVLAKPNGFMNVAGGPVGALVQYFKVPVARLVVVHDELELPFGRLRLKQDGGEGGHNGLRSVSGALGTRAYGRLRVGIGRPPGRMDPAAFVLRDFAAAEREDAAVTVALAADVVVDLARAGWEHTLPEVNARG